MSLIFRKSATKLIGAGSKNYAPNKVSFVWFVGAKAFNN